MSGAEKALVEAALECLDECFGNRVWFQGEPAEVRLWFALQRVRAERGLPLPEPSPEKLEERERACDRWPP